MKSTKLPEYRQHLDEFYSHFQSVWEKGHGSVFLCDLTSCWKWSQGLSVLCPPDDPGVSEEVLSVSFAWRVRWPEQRWTPRAGTPKENLRTRLKKVAVSFQWLAATDRFNFCFVPWNLALPLSWQDSACCTRSKLCSCQSFVWRFWMAWVCWMMEMRWMASDENGHGTECSDAV